MSRHRDFLGKLTRDPSLKWKKAVSTKIGSPCNLGQQEDTISCKILIANIQDFEKQKEIPKEMGPPGQHLNSATNVEPGACNQMQITSSHLAPH